MDTIQIILLIGSIAGAITAVSVLVVKIVKVIKSIVNFFHTLSSNVSTLLRHDSAQYKAILRLTITADHMPMSERLLAGKEYVEELNGNGEVKALYNALKERCEQADKK